MNILQSGFEAIMMLAAALSPMFPAAVQDQPFDYGKVAGYTEAYRAENEAVEMTEMFRLEIENSVNGPISVSRDGGQTWERIGRTLAPCATTNPKGFTASGWGDDGTVTATAVNAIHIKIRQNEELEKGVLFSLLPKEFYEKPKDYNSYYAQSASIVTDMPAGALLFGGRWSPFVGNEAFIKDGSGALRGLVKDYIPTMGDNIVIVAKRPKRYPKEIVFENRVGGQVSLIYLNGERKTIGKLHRKVGGVGRFEGTLYANTGRIRAIHPGVVDISTSPIGQIGGFQIIPEMHSRSPEMALALQLTQWMIVGPPNDDDPGLPGIAPLFDKYLRPVYLPLNDGDALLERFLVRVKLEGSDEWQRMPEAMGRIDDALENVTAVRIMFPVYPSFQRPSDSKSGGMNVSKAVSASE